ncbi:MAG TPA: amidohydrolase family protein [Candidatus Binataceae bacterium]|nr:amidohydrolase family protein [Candidatus Binataceae bacterium]
MDLSINNVRLFDGAAMREGLFCVGIAGDKITSVGSATLPANREINAAGMFLMPGLIDCHIHLLNMWTATDEKTMAADLEQEMPKRLEDFLAAGVTTVKSVGDSEDDILRVRAMLRNGELRGPRLFTTGAAFAAPGSHPATTIFGRNPWIRRRTSIESDSAPVARDVVRRLAEKKVDAIKIVHQGGCKHGEPYFFRSDALGINIQIHRLEPEVLEAIVDEAHKHGLKATVHTFDQEAAIEALEAGADGLEHGIMDHELKGARVIELLLRNRASYVPTLWLLTFEEQAAAVRYANLKRIADAGVRVVLGSDTFCGFGKFGENTIVEAERSSAAGIAHEKVLKMATKDAAEHLGADALGTIATGKLADLLLLDGDPTADITALRKVVMVVKDGAILVDKM